MSANNKLFAFDIDFIDLKKGNFDVDCILGFVITVFNYSDITVCCGSHSLMTVE